MIWRTNYKMKPPVRAKLVKGHPLARGLVAGWLMNENGGNEIWDFSGNANTGSFQDNPIWSAGWLGSCLQFDGVDDYINCGSRESVDISGALSIAVNLKPGANIIARRIIAKSTGNESVYMAMVPTKFCFKRDYATTPLEVVSNIVVTPGTVYNLMVTWDGVDKNGVRFYLDGVDYGVTSTGGGTGARVDHSADDLLIGTDQNLYFDGHIAYVVMWNRELSPSEVLHFASQPFCMFDWSWVFDVPSAVPPEAAAAWLAWLQQEWFLRHGRRAEVPPGVIESGAAWFAWSLQDWWLRHGRPAELPRPPREAAALWMDLDSQDWFLRHAQGQYAKI